MRQVICEFNIKILWILPLFVMVNIILLYTMGRFSKKEPLAYLEKSFCEKTVFDTVI